jgi:hypothetical protein
MFKKIYVLILSGVMVLGLSGCFALFVGAGAGAGTAGWLSGKLTQEFHASYEDVIKAAEKGLKELDLPVVKESKEALVTQIISKYTDGKEIWIDIRKITAGSTKVEVRVGSVNPDKVASDKILKKIQSSLWPYS